MENLTVTQKNALIALLMYGYADCTKSTFDALDRKGAIVRNSLTEIIDYGYDYVRAIIEEQSEEGNLIKFLNILFRKHVYSTHSGELTKDYIKSCRLVANKYPNADDLFYDMITTFVIQCRKYEEE